MLFGKDKKSPIINPLSRPLEAAALGRWRTLNETSGEQEPSPDESTHDERLIDIHSKDELSDTQKLQKSTPWKMEEMRTEWQQEREETGSFIKEEIPLINLHHAIEESMEEYSGEYQSEDREDSAREEFNLGGYNQGFENNIKDLESDFSPYINYQTRETEEQEDRFRNASTDSTDNEDVTEDQLYHHMESSIQTETPPPPREKTPVGDFSSNVEDDIRNRFGSNLKSALGHGTVIEGMFSFEDPVKIDGSLKGEVRSTSALIVGPDAHVNARIKVGTLIVLGSVQGEVEAEDLIEVRSTGLLDGDLVTRRFAVEEGGIFNGACTMIE
ncbi:MAG TPA: polymer-forming cytoskeletal protein [Oligoflexia bacterium]|mgnify:CR=1 FL=1|nr:polymer-forming cytoskeletal protein [Oligoflexia bacterium]HMP49366.1 polymer-forming cytoskeletal protein [Oligoflexia bacterium]